MDAGDWSTCVALRDAVPAPNSNRQVCHRLMWDFGVLFWTRWYWTRVGLASNGPADGFSSVQTRRLFWHRCAFGQPGHIKTARNGEARKKWSHVNRTAWAARARAVFCICVMFASGILAPLLNINFLSDMISRYTFGNMS